MLSIKNLRAGQSEYYRTEDDYTKGARLEWFGRGAQTLQLVGEVDAKGLSNLFGGFHPVTGAALVQNAGADDRQAGWDLTFSAPKSVSVLWSALARPEQERIESCVHDAAGRAISFLEDSAALTRRGHAGIAREKVGLVGVSVLHHTSRSLDPQLHVHSVLTNIGVRADGTTGTILSRPLYVSKMAAGALFRAELSHLLETRLGLAIERDGASFRVRGVPKPLCDEFSKRRRLIEAELSLRGHDSARAAAAAALDTRDVKTHVPLERLQAVWGELRLSHGFTEESAMALLGRSLVRTVAFERERATKDALTRLTERQSTFSKLDLLRHLAEEAQGRGLGASEVLRAADAAVRDEKRVVPLGRLGGEVRYTTPEVMRLEAETLNQLKALHDGIAPTVSRDSLEAGVQDTEARLLLEVRSKDPLAAPPRLSDEHRRALNHLLTPGRVHVIVGPAGSGKTTLLHAAARMLERSGYTVVGTAVAGVAADRLQKGAEIDSYTLAKLLHLLEGNAVRHPDILLHSRTAVIVDEAAMAGTRQLSRLVGHVGQSGGRLVLVGDHRQLQSVELGGVFLGAARRFGSAELKAIIRQEDLLTRELVRDAGDGLADKVLDALIGSGRLHLARTRAGAMTELLAHWQREGLARPRDHLILANLNVEVAQLNRLAQSLRLKGRLLGPDCVEANGTRFFVGDRVLCTRNDYRLGVRNGSLGTVAAVNTARDLLWVELDSGGRALLPLTSYPHLRLGYALTSYKSQGATVESAYVLAGGPMQDRESTYVQLSRARRDVHLFVDREEAGERLSLLVRQMEKSRAKELAHDVRARTKGLAVPIELGGEV